MVILKCTSLAVANVHGRAECTCVAAAEMLVLCVFKVVNGPMDVVKTIDHMMSRLSPRLMEERDHVTFKSPNISKSYKAMLHTVLLDKSSCEDLPFKKKKREIDLP